MCGAGEASFRVLGKRLNRSQGGSPHRKAGITTTVVRCKKCGLIFSNPLPVPASIQDHYGQPPESYWTGNYFHTDELYFAGQIAWLRRLIDVKPGIRALDIGAGIGKCMIALEREGIEAHGLEGSEPFYERAIGRMKIRPDRLKRAAMEEADYPESYFDFVTFGAVLEHLYDPSDSIARAMRWLRPGGVIHIEVPSAAWLGHRLINAYYRVRRGDYVGNISPMHPPYHLYEFSMASFRAHAARLGYEIADHGYYVCNTFLPKAIDAVLKPYMKWTRTGKQLAVWLRKKKAG